MSGSEQNPRALLSVVEDALTLLSRHSSQGMSLSLTDTTRSLFDRCQAEQIRISQRKPEPVRLVHHLACTGGTLIARFLAATANTRLLSEIDPLSPLTKLHFSPSDLLLHYRHGLRPVADAPVEEAFIAALRVLHDTSRLHGERLVLREHSHSRFCTGSAVMDRDGLHAMLARHGIARVSVVTVRHPLDSFLSLQSNGWRHFEPFTIDEYARRYLAFLDDHDGLPLFRYEDFVARPEETLRDLCAALELVHATETRDLVPLVQLTGDSGRRGDTPGPRARRPVAADIAADLARSDAYARLCQRLNYPIQGD
ncbi:MAG: hypothetical protein KJZ59_00195 [Pararhodobacter sp.]|nr:hypothetical protein [Pararhodobacter sp.]